MEQEKSTSLKDQYKKVKSEGSDDKKKKPKGSFLGGDVDIESLSPMKFETKPVEKKRTPEEIEAARMALARPKPQPSEPSLLEKAKRFANASIDMNVGRATGDTKRMMRGYKVLSE